jgi:hypothetical protein
LHFSRYLTTEYSETTAHFKGNFERKQERKKEKKRKEKKKHTEHCSDMDMQKY